MSKDTDRKLSNKLARMVKGERVITNSNELDAMMKADSDVAIKVRTIPNPNRVGVLDQYIGWI